MERVKVVITNDQKKVKVPTGIRLLIRRCCHAVLELENFEGSAEVSVRFVDNEEIRRLNAEYRNIDRETDVLSFPLGENGVYDVNLDTGAKLLGDIRPLLMVTDPPYGVEYDPAWRNATGAAKTKRTGKVLNDDRADWREAWALFPGDVVYVWHGALHATTVADSLIAAGFDIRSQIIWAKDRLVLSRGDYHWQHEPCWYAVKKRGKGHWAGDRKQTTLWQIANRDQDAETVHGTQKPVECMRRPILNNSSPGQAIYEPFMGSGTTLIAAETTGRVCYGIELNPAYVDVAIARWQNLTGQAAVLDGTDKTFADLTATRR